MIHTNAHPTTILIIDDEPGIHKSLTHLLQSNFSVHTALSGEEGLEKADTMSPDLILLDMVMPRMSGMEVLSKLMQASKDIPVIMFTGYGSIDSAVRAIKLGATDYIEKPFNIQKLRQTVQEILKGREGIQKLPSRQNIIGESLQIQKVWKAVEKYGPTDLPILIQGETGTGKELFARAIHEISKRVMFPFVPVDCSTIPETLFESEIFGYEKGAFTGAAISKPGQLEWADKGTFFLDEISNLPLAYQAKVLRVLQEQRYVPLGARADKGVDVRFISSSNMDIKEAVKHGAFREDLYYRISGVCIELPPLRERKGDLELLVRYFIGRYAIKYNRPTSGISDEAMELLLLYPWPGNVRELEQTIGAAMASADRVILPDDLPPNLQKKVSVSRERDSGRIRFELSFSCDVAHPINLKALKEKVSAEAEKSIIAEVKKRFTMSQTNMAKFLGIDPKTLRTKSRKIRVYKKSPEQRVENKEQKDRSPLLHAL